MSVITQHQYAGHTVDLGPDGFMVDSEQWSREVGEAIAAEAGITLTPKHWQVIEFCRDDAKEQNGEAPGLRRISKNSGVPMKELYQLFPKGPGKLAAKVAGLPKPHACI